MSSLLDLLRMNSQLMLQLCHFNPFHAFHSLVCSRPVFSSRIYACVSQELFSPHACLLKCYRPNCVSSLSLSLLRLLHISPILSSFMWSHYQYEYRLILGERAQFVELLIYGRNTPKRLVQNFCLSKPFWCNYMSSLNENVKTIFEIIFNFIFRDVVIVYISENCVCSFFSLVSLAYWPLFGYCTYD